ncbi:hypothetical protein M427DRAFT_46829 [Gonapodya prolifera JEL478]|uniref:Uncharacterized protein n=1 Tax=Gonapodya prolifera (strain JEL478) TaxID=1344416 RepID=A0A139A4S6_GONPJ|nr:hypothetical protein M427DRAFT_46829 [Gonapodya prolifera JEL478]|eukprot:KXS11812.1 hypothetical protein M427DRAFT_46829 [Gonapodya prolifera JEL478]
MSPQFDEYEIKFNVRRVSLDDYPQAAHGTSAVCGSGDAHVITLNANFSIVLGSIPLQGSLQQGKLQTNLVAKTSPHLLTWMASALGLSGQSYFSPNATVTPQISGVFNGDVLKALSTLDSANYAGYAIIPRFPTEVYYHCSTVNENLAIYKMLYNTTLDISPWDQVLQREASRILAAMMSLCHDPQMFHQANLRNADQPSATINGVVGKWGLLQQWTESMLGQYKTMVNWPVVAVKMDTLAQYYRSHREREAREACGITTQFTISNRTLSALTVKTTNACTVGVAVPPSALTTRNSAYKYEQLSSVDPLTVWIPMTAGQTVTLPLTKRIMW